MKLSAVCSCLHVGYENITYQHALWNVGKNTDFNSGSTLSLLPHKVAGVGSGLIRIQDTLPLIYCNTLLGMLMEYNPVRKPYKYPHMTHTRHHWPQTLTHCSGLSAGPSCPLDQHSHSTWYCLWTYWRSNLISLSRPWIKVLNRAGPRSGKHPCWLSTNWI